MFRPTLQPELFDRQQYRSVHPFQVISHMPQSEHYRRWWCSPRHDRQKYEVLVRQGFKCDECGYLLNPRSYDVHHSNGYAALGYEEASDLVAVHRACHRKMEERIRQQACGCARVA